MERLREKEYNIDIDNYDDDWEHDEDAWARMKMLLSSAING